MMTGAYSSIGNISRRAFINGRLHHHLYDSSVYTARRGGSIVVRSFALCSRPFHHDNIHPSTLLERTSRDVPPHCASTSRTFHSSTCVWKDYPIHTLLPFPALSPTMEMGTISKWELSEGDSFSAGSVLCSIETDKATMDFEAQDDGVLAKILRDGPTAVDLPIGSPIAIIVDDAADVAAFADYVLSVDEPAAPAAAVAPVPPSATSAAPASPAVVGGVAGTSVLLPSARFLAESKYVFGHAYLFSMLCKFCAVAVAGVLRCIIREGWAFRLLALYVMVHTVVFVFAGVSMPPA
jgi:hypothetical protein